MTHNAAPAIFRHTGNLAGRAEVHTLLKRFGLVTADAGGEMLLVSRDDGRRIVDYDEIKETGEPWRKQPEPLPHWTQSEKDRGCHMREARFILEGVEAFYCLSNEIGPDLQDLSGPEQEELVSRLFDAAKLCHIDILAYTAHPRGYGMLVRIPRPYDISRRLLVMQAKEYFGRDPEKNLTDPREDPGSEAHAAVDRMLRGRLFNLQEFARLYGMRFSLSYNKRHNRKGPVWKQRFRSSVVEHRSEYLMSAIAYIHTRPAVMNEGTKLADYEHSSWVEAIEGNRKRRRDYKEVSGDSDWRKAKSRYGLELEAMMKRINRPHYGTIDSDLVDAHRRKNRTLSEELEDRRRRWQTMYGRLKKYVAENGHFLFPRNSENYRELLKWVRNQRSHCRRGTLSQRNIDALDRLGFPWDAKKNIIKGIPPETIQGSVWMEKYELLKAYYKAQGDLMPPYADRTVHQWIRYQRARRRGHRLSETQIELLDSISFPWEVGRRS